VAKAIRATVRQFGIRGCAGLMAQEFGDHPEAPPSACAGSASSSPAHPPDRASGDRYARCRAMSQIIATTTFAVAWPCSR
jgi:hypothetical protein